MHYSLPQDLLRSSKTTIAYILRVSACCEHPLLTQFDDQLRLALTKTCNIPLTDDQWTQASLPVWSGGLGV